MAERNPPRGEKHSRSVWGLEQIQELIDLLEKRDISEFEMEKGGVRIRIKRGNPHGPAPLAATPALSSHTFAPHIPPVAPPAPGPVPVEPHPSESGEEVHLIKSPIVGTFFASPAPDAPAFVKLGDVVEVGQVLCIIEAMKLMNEIESEVAGKIARIYVESGQPVEYGQSLFAIRPAEKK